MEIVMDITRQFIYSHLYDELKAIINDLNPCEISVSTDEKGQQVASCYATAIGATRGEIDEDTDVELPLAKDYLCCTAWSKPKEPCRYWSKTGCQTDCLACKTWLCRPLIKHLFETYHTATPRRQELILTLFKTIQDANFAIKTRGIVALPHNSSEFCHNYKEGMEWRD
ncbi:hypothetical protein FACS189452_01910 [Bacteroidia bacterium]|nr:hypothetical protein FACS189452_01910 [Bacteroidia bacterium]GHT81410.1 hypothetical protein FACS189467_5410 [Bacteroidia bacterium]